MRKLPVRTGLLLLQTLFLSSPAAAETAQVPTVPCCHNWQEVYHPEERHEEIVCVDADVIPTRNGAHISIAILWKIRCIMVTGVLPATTSLTTPPIPTGSVLSAALQLQRTLTIPLLLTMDKYEAQAASYVQSRSIRSGYLLGGETLIPDGSARLIFSLSSNYRISVK